MNTRLNAVLLVPVLFLLPGSGRCEDFLRSGASARSAATGGAYLPGSDSPLDAMAINPAGLALLTGRVVEVSAAGMFARGRFVNSSNPAGRLSAQGLVPYGAFGTPIGRGRIIIGFASTPELASAARWQYNDTPGGVGGVSYARTEHNSGILALRTSGGIGIYLGPKLQIGATLGSVYNSNKLETVYVFQNHPGLAGLKTTLDLRTSGIGWNGSVGVLARASKRLQLGAAWKSRTVVESKGTATGNAGEQFTQIGLGTARPDFRYDARVRNVFPKTVVVHGLWRINSSLRILAQGDWVNWKKAFINLPVSLTRGTNADINALLGTDVIEDSIPLHWRDQFTARVGIEKSWLENATLRAGYAHATNPVPASTLSPLTAAITRNTVSAGIGYTPGRYRFDLAYSIDPTATSRVGRSMLKSGEYSNSSISVGTQALILTTGIRF
ncbi:MAG: OmpP1/FadL family transporter [Bryobacteraceae bacterium]